MYIHYHSTYHMELNPSLFSLPSGGCLTQYLEYKEYNNECCWMNEYMDEQNNEYNPHPPTSPGSILDVAAWLRIQGTVVMLNNSKMYSTLEKDTTQREKMQI